MYVQTNLSSWWNPFSSSTACCPSGGFFGPPLGSFPPSGLSGFSLGLPGGYYNGGMLGEAMGSTIGWGSWGSPELARAYMVDQLILRQFHNGGLYGCNPHWNQFQSQLQNSCCCTEQPACEPAQPEVSEQPACEPQAPCAQPDVSEQPACEPPQAPCAQPEVPEEPACEPPQAPCAQPEVPEEPACEPPQAPGDQPEGVPVEGPADQGQPEGLNDPPAEAQVAEESNCQPGLADASRTVAENFDLLDTASGHDRDGLVSREDLQSLLANNPDAPPELREACELMLRNETFFNAADAAQGGRPDGLISQDDANRAAEKFAAIEQRPPQEQFTPAGTAEVLERYAPLLDTANGGEADGVFGREDLQRVLDDPDAPAELKQAARQTLENGYLFNAYDDGKNNEGHLDGKISVDDLRAARERLQSIAVEPVEGTMTEAQAARTLERYLPLVDYAAGQGGRDEKIGRADLEALAASPDLPPDLRQAVDLLMGNPAYFNQFDQAGDSNGDLDGEIGRKGLEVLSGQC